MKEISPLTFILSSFGMAVSMGQVKWLIILFKCLRYLIVVPVELSSRRVDIQVWNSGEGPGLEEYTWG